MSESLNSESFPPQEKIDRLPQWDSGYKPVALKTLEKVMPGKIRLTHPESTKESIQEQVLEKREKLRVWLDAIDAEVVRNFGVFESEENPGVRFPYTKVSVNNAASYVQNKPANSETEKAPDKIIVIFRVFSRPPGGAPDDDMNLIYDRVLTALPETAYRKDRPAKNITVFALGLPTSKWGSISEEWLSDLKKGVEEDKEGTHGFSQYGELYAEFFRTVLSKYPEDWKDKANIAFYAGSMGTILADQTARQLPELRNKWNSLRLLLNNPAGVHNPTGKKIKLPLVGTIPLSAKGAKVLGGFGAEAAVRMYVPFVDNVVKTAMSGAKPAREALTVVLQQKGIMSYESDEQNRLKKDASGQAVKLLMRGTPLDTEHFRSFIEQGAFDPATTNSEIRSLMHNNIYKRYFRKNSSLGIAVNFTHWMDPGRWPDKWVRGIERYEKSVNA